MKTRRTLTCILLIMGAIILCAPSVNAQSKSVKSKPRATKTKVVVPKQQRPATPSPVETKERTIKDLLYFPYSCLPADVSNAEEAQNMLTNYFGSCERVDNIYYGLHRNDSFDYTYRGVPIGLTFYDWFDNRQWYHFYFDTMAEAMKFYNALAVDLKGVGIPMTKDKAYGGVSNRSRSLQYFKSVYIFPPMIVKEADAANIHRADVVGKYQVEFGVYKKK